LPLQWESFKAALRVHSKGRWRYGALCRPTRNDYQKCCRLSILIKFGESTNRNEFTAFQVLDESKVCLDAEPLSTKDRCNYSDDVVCLCRSVSHRQRRTRRS